MALYLVQHGKSLLKEQDPEKGLSEQGLSDVEGIAEVARAYAVKVTRIQHSGKKRAYQTADIFATNLNPEGGVLETSGLKPMDDVSDIANTIDSRDNIMLVGHLPFMERLTSFLITGSIDNPVLKFQNGGIVCMDRDPDNQYWFIKWTLVPLIE